MDAREVVDWQARTMGADEIIGYLAFPTSLLD